MTKYGVWAIRLPSSVFGGKQAWAKGPDGKPLVFDTLAAARAQALEYIDNVSSSNVYYVPKEFDK